jgi:hypothetical protein
MRIKSTWLAAALIVLAAALTLAAATAAAPPARSTPINATLVGAGCDLPTTPCRSFHVQCDPSLCSNRDYEFAGDATIPRLGTFHFFGDYNEIVYCTPDYTACPNLAYIQDLTLTLTAPTGDQLVLVGSYSSTIQPPLLLNGDTVAGTWTVDQTASTGKYAQYTGSGSYTLTYPYNGSFFTFAVTLNGSLN